MKMNLPVTGQEILFPVNKIMVTKTNTKGLITFANLDFIEISGFSDEELMGANHNIIRHPDMPAVAFEILWETLKRGQPWHGIVKNRCKNGDHYWVSAKIVPIKKNGQVSGYMSVRSCPSRDEVASAEAAYKIAANAPETVKRDFAPGWKKHWSIKNGIPIWILAVTLMLVAGGLLGITGLNQSKQGIQSLQHEELEPVQVIGRINFLMADNRAQVVMALRQGAEPYSTTLANDFVPDYIQTMVRNKDEIDRLWGSYVGRIKEPAEKELAAHYVQARGQFVQDGLFRVKQAIDERNYAKADELFRTNVIPLYDKANNASSALLAHLTKRGNLRVAHISELSTSIINIALIGISVCFLGLVACGLFFFRVTAIPLEKAVQELENIAEGNLSGNVNNAGYGEPGRVMAAVMITQMHLKVMMHEMQKSSKSIREQCRNLNAIMMNLAEHSDEQHDRVYQTVDAVTESRVAMGVMAENMDALLQVINAGDDAMAEEVTATDFQHIAIESIPIEFQDIFGEPQDPMFAGVVHEPSAARVVVEERVSLPGMTDMNRQVQSLVGATRVQFLAVEDVTAQLNQVAGLIVQNREDVQGAWTASQQLEKTAHELDLMVKYFE